MSLYHCVDRSNVHSFSTPQRVSVDGALSRTSIQFAGRLTPWASILGLLDFPDFRDFPDHGELIKLPGVAEGPIFPIFVENWEIRPPG